ncbi:MAG: succinate dehydrogenase, hydrophobic membrane anchor protein [Proteobacteria bacterium]|nr:succinate dehydrogenase, hydrophobic membrane anchor protein [Pseudomonadota bacterium]MBS0574248.1 succinate dehydrogenase, hydrophobic membrane anchor protein [Pseudomonadota bacterium]
MRYITDRKRATGRGSARSGTEHHWYMQASAVGLAFLVPWFVYCVGRALTLPYGDAWYLLMQPYVSIPMGLAVFVGMRHFAKGATMMIEDYTRGTWRKALVIAALSLSYAVTAVGLYALIVITLKA